MTCRPTPALALTILALPILVLTLAPAAAARNPEVPPATPAGPAVTCVPLAQIRTSRVRDDRTIDFVMRGDKVYRNVLPNSCPELGSERAFSYETSLSQLCNVDIITVYRNGTPIPRGASCGLGMFQPVVIDKKYK